MKGIAGSGVDVGGIAVGVDKGWLDGEPHEVVVVDLRTDAEYGRIVGQIAAADRVISW